MKNRHSWREETEEGLQREFRATKFAGRWKFQSKIKGDAQWTREDPPRREDLEQLRELLHRKYLRRRVPHEDVQAIEQLIQKQRQP